MLPDEPNDEERQEALPEDNETPFRPAEPATDVPAAGADTTNDGTLADDHPTTDSNIQPEELYDEGVSGAAEASEPNSDNNVTDYTPPSSGGDQEEV